MIKIGGVYTTVCQWEGILLQKYRHRNGRCIAILFKKGRGFDSSLLSQSEPPHLPQTPPSFPRHCTEEQKPQTSAKEPGRAKICWGGDAIITPDQPQQSLGLFRAEATKKSEKSLAASGQKMGNDQEPFNPHNLSTKYHWGRKHNLIKSQRI